MAADSAEFIDAPAILAAAGKRRAAMTVAETRLAMTAGRRWQAAPPVGVVVTNAVANGVNVRLYGPESATVLLYLHGGRFFSGDLESHDWPLRQLASLSGRRICAVDYRLAPEHRHPAACEDTLAAGRWLRQQADAITIGGDSAGGYLAAFAAPELAPQLQILIYPMLDPACRTASYGEFWQGPWPNGEDMKRGWVLYGGDAIRAAPGRFPRTLLVTAGVDPLRDEAWDFAAELRTHNVVVDLHHFPDMHHGFFTQTRLRRSLELMTLLARQLAQ